MIGSDCQMTVDMDTPHLHPFLNAMHRHLLGMHVDFVAFGLVGWTNGRLAG